MAGKILIAFILGLIVALCSIGIAVSFLDDVHLKFSLETNSNTIWWGVNLLALGVICYFSTNYVIDYFFKEKNVGPGSGG